MKNKVSFFFLGITSLMSAFSQASDHFFDQFLHLHPTGNIKLTYRSDPKSTIKLSFWKDNFYGYSGNWTTDWVEALYLPFWQMRLDKGLLTFLHLNDSNFVQKTFEESSEIEDPWSGRETFFSRMSQRYGFMGQEKPQHLISCFHQLLDRKKKSYNDVAQLMIQENPYDPTRSKFATFSVEPELWYHPTDEILLRLRGNSISELLSKLLEKCSFQ